MNPYSSWIKFIGTKERAKKILARIDVWHESPEKILGDDLDSFYHIEPVREMLDAWDTGAITKVELKSYARLILAERDLNTRAET